ncbi:MAG: B12-binding domain-containing radical SAM protein, partial [Turicibacter sp.]
NMSKASVIALAKAITDAGLNTIPWATMGRADRIDDEQLDALVEAGLYSIKYGVESAEQSILDASEKYIDINKVISGIQKTAARGIKVHLTFTFGLPGDTIETIEKTIDLACELPCDTVQFSIATPYPGTRMYEMYKEAGWLQSENWEDYVGSTKAVSRTENFTGEQLEFYVHEAYRRFNLSRQVKKFHDGNYAQTLCDGLLDRGISKDKRIVLLQCANITFSKLVLTTLKNNGWDVKVFTHERFVDDLSTVIDAPRITTFNNVKNFDYQNLRSQLSSLIDDGCIVFAPCSNNDGSGYEEVRKLMALSLAPSVMFTMEGTFI